jgi:predicted ferric reductase
VVVALSAVAVLLWALAAPLGPRFADTSTSLRSLGNAIGLAGISAFACNLFLGGRFWFVEPVFGGLDRMYKVHRKIGEWAFGLLSAHALFMLAGYGAISLDSALRLLTPGSLTTFLGFLALIGMAFALFMTLFARLNHEMFIYVHRVFGVAFILGVLHVFRTAGTKALSPALTYYLAALCLLGGAGYLYRSVFGRTLVRRLRYRVVKVDRLDEFVTEVVMAPIGERLDYAPGQFVFVTFESRGIREEFRPMDIETEPATATVTLRTGAVTNQAHPFSITSAPGSAHLRVAVKALGDFTNALRALEVGALVHVEGPYGAFSYRNIGNPKQVWIAGGIGVTPFLSMARSLTEDQYEIDFYYAMETGEENYFIEDFYALGDQNPRVRTVPIRKDQLGFMTADDVEGVSRNLPEKDILICGPPPMMHALKTQFVSKGVPEDQIHFEEFGFANVRHVPRKH